MHTLALVTATGRTEIRVGEGAAAHLPEGQLLCILDTAAKDLVPLPANTPTLLVEGGEETKSLRMAERAYEFLLRAGANRDAFLLGVGGGSVTDLTGFVGSTFHRGIRFGFVPTTLMAQVDAAIGGKNGLNLGSVKNQIGTVSQPALVLCDPAVLRTLPEASYRDGFAEMVKHALIADAAYLSFLEQSLAKLQTREVEALTQAIKRSIEIKTEIVAGDELDQGERAKLNFGHTIGHGIERTAALSHGSAVSLGMLAELRFSESRAHCAPAVRERIAAVLASFGLPTHLSIESDRVRNVIDHDKKRGRTTLRTALISEVGKSNVQEVSYAEFLAEALR